MFPTVIFKTFRMPCNKLLPVLTILFISFSLSCSDLFNNEQEDPLRFAEEEYFYENGERVYVERSLDLILPFLKFESDTDEKRLFLDLISEYNLQIFEREDFNEVDFNLLYSKTDSALNWVDFGDFVYKIPKGENPELFYTNTKTIENFGNNELLEYSTPVYRGIESKEWIYVGNRLYIVTEPENQIPEETISKYSLEKRDNYVKTTKVFVMKDMITFKPIETVRLIYEEDVYENVRPSRLFRFGILD